MRVMFLMFFLTLTWQINKKIKKCDLYKKEYYFYKTIVHKMFQMHTISYFDRKYNYERTRV